MINVTPVDNNSNIGSPINKSYTVNIKPSGNSTSVSSRFYRATESISINSLFNVVSTWTLIGKVTISGAPTGGFTDLDFTGFPVSANAKLCVLTEADAINDFSAFVGVTLGNNSFRAVNVELYECP